MRIVVRIGSRALIRVHSSMSTTGLVKHFREHIAVAQDGRINVGGSRRLTEDCLSATASVSCLVQLGAEVAKREGWIPLPSHVSGLSCA